MRRVEVGRRPVTFGPFSPAAVPRPSPTLHKVRLAQRARKKSESGRGVELLPLAVGPRAIVPVAAHINPRPGDPGLLDNDVHPSHVSPLDLALDPPVGAENCPSIVVRHSSSFVLPLSSAQVATRRAHVRKFLYSSLVSTRQAAA
jgi:hypothetical protein